MVFRRKLISAENALMRLEALCSRSEHCEWELREKLRGWGVGIPDAEKILATLHKARYYDDERFARAFARDKLIYNRWGRRKIALALRAKRVDDVVVADALDEIDNEEYVSVLNAMMKARAKVIKEGHMKGVQSFTARPFRGALNRSLCRKSYGQAVYGLMTNE